MKRSSGFTIVELMVVIGIFALIVSWGSNVYQQVGDRFKRDRYREYTNTFFHEARDMSRLYEGCYIKWDWDNDDLKSTAMNFRILDKDHNVIKKLDCEYGMNLAAVIYDRKRQKFSDTNMLQYDRRGVCWLRECDASDCKLTRAVLDQRPDINDVHPPQGLSFDFAPSWCIGLSSQIYKGKMINDGCAKLSCYTGQC